MEFLSDFNEDRLFAGMSEIKMPFALLKLNKLPDLQRMAVKKHPHHVKDGAVKIMQPQKHRQATLSLTWMSL